MSWLIENLATIIIGAALAAILVLVIVRMVRNKKQGKTSCGCGCSGCPMEGKCRK